MKPQTWHDRRKLMRQGYFLILRFGMAYLFNPSQQVCRVTPIDMGLWRERPLEEWEQYHTELVRMYFLLIAANCYCPQVEICDYCSGLRKPEQEITLYQSLENQIQKNQAAYYQ